jgi:hypothetical protein
MRAGVQYASAERNVQCWLESARRPGPDEGFGILVVNVDVFADGRFQFLHASEYATTNPLVADLGEPALHQIDPGAVGGSEMKVKARSFGQTTSG